MADGAPLTKLSLVARSVADDLGFVALADLALVVPRADGDQYRIIGGHMVTVLAARWRLGAELYRETADTDLGVPPLVVRDGQILDGLRELGYEQIQGDRFARQLSDIPAGLDGHAPVRQAMIDVLIPAYTGRARTNQAVGDRLVTTEVPGLALALQRPAVQLTLSMRRMNGDVLSANLAFPDEVSAVVLKANATQVRQKSTDLVDLWRCTQLIRLGRYAPAIKSSSALGPTDPIHSESRARVIATNNW